MEENNSLKKVYYWLGRIFIFTSLAYAVGFFLYLLFFMDASHPLGFQVNGENL